MGLFFLCLISANLSRNCLYLSVEATKYKKQKNMGKNDPLNVIAPRGGFTIITDIAEYDDSWDSILVLTDTVFTTLEENDILLTGVATSSLTAAKTNIATTVTIVPAGAMLTPENDVWSKIKLTSGTIQAFKA